MTDVANVACPAPGERFRMILQRVQRLSDPLPDAAAVAGAFVHPKGERWPVEACDDHVGAVA